MIATIPPFGGSRRRSARSCTSSRRRASSIPNVVNLPQADARRPAHAGRARRRSGPRPSERHGRRRQRDRAPTRRPARTTSRRAARSRCSSRPAPRRSTVPTVVGFTGRRGAGDAARQRTCSRRWCSQPTSLQGNDGKVLEPETRPAGTLVDPQSTGGAHGRRVHRRRRTTTRRPRRRPTTTRPGRDRDAATGRALARWYDANGRHDLPWRATRDRWLVLVSEVMLHQTQAPRVAQVYDAFVAQFPTPAATAAASPADVIAAWGRLGYPRRARWLWEAARRIDADGWPDDLARAAGRRALHRGRGRRAGRRRRRDRHRGQHPARVRARARRAPVDRRSRSARRSRSPRRCAAATGCSR